jgi:hypothetical protein
LSLKHNPFHFISDPIANLRLDYVSSSPKPFFPYCLPAAGADRCMVGHLLGDFELSTVAHIP